MSNITPSSASDMATQTQLETNKKANNDAQLLDVVAMPLKGRHLIEASAGTGKTFNITRLYLRLLLEKKLTVKEILVMTFTKAATEEIKGRIAKTLREAFLIWQQAKENDNQIDSNCDPVYQHLFTRCNTDESMALLKAAQLELDEASVFTIHAFCQHVITQLAFNSGFAMSLNLGNDTSDLYLQAAEDYIRKVSKNEDDFRLLAESGWHTPERLLLEFNASIKSTLTPLMLSEQDIELAYQRQLDESPHTSVAYVKTLSQSVEDNEGLLVEQLIKTPAHKKERPQELAALKSWLRSCADSGQYYLPPPEAEAFVKGTRYARNSSGVKEILTPIKEFATALKKVFGEKDKALAKVPVFKLVIEAIAFIKGRVDKQKKQLGVIDFDDLIRMLADEVVKPNNTLVPELRKKFPVALIDEFQDTDAKQYAILDAVYPNASSNSASQTETDLSNDNEESASARVSALLMIGDPKQAIYRFRGGDIFTYLKAGRQADYRWVMNTNWRSVEGMVKAYNRLFYGAPVASNTPTDVFGFDIKYNPVEFTPKAAAAKTPLRDPAAQRSAMNYVSLCLEEKENTNIMRRKMAQWIAQEIYRLLNEAQFQLDNGETKPVKPQDIAILVKDRTEAGAIKNVLQQKGLACVYLSDRSNLFASAEAKDVLRLLNGIWHANDTSNVSSSLASPLWGYSPQTLIELLYHEDDAMWDKAMDKVLSLRDMWLQKGCMSVLLHLMQDSYVPHADNVERALTNYQHLAEVLEKASTTHQRPEQLLDWLNKQIHKPESDEELTLRLESDSQLIRLITQHGSKGLEYPIVFVPYATGYKDASKNGKSTSQIFTFYDEDKQDLQMQLGQTAQAIARVQRESEAEDMRLAYVAVTRAAHRCYMGVIPLANNEKSALARALGLSGDESTNRDWPSVLRRVAEEDESHASYIDGDEFEEIYSGFEQGDAIPQLTALQFTGTASEEWRLYSFSAMSRLTTVGSVKSTDTVEGAGQSLPSVPVLRTVRDEEVYALDTLSTDGEILGAIDVDSHTPLTQTSAVTKNDLRFTLEKGASAGNLLHDILEHSDFSAPVWEETGKELVNRFGLEEKRTPFLYEWLEEVLQTPLYPNVQLCMSDLTLEQTLREAEFYFPMNDTQWKQLREVLNTHRQTVAETLGGEAEPAPQLITAKLKGMMHGFIDLIFEHDGQFFVADYKSTWLGDTLESYMPSALFHNNQHHLYDLQYLIYCLALHRYLSNTLPDYEPDIHFGGVYYLYLRGMHPENEQGEGVFYTHIPSSLLHQLDAIFASKSATHTPPDPLDNGEENEAPLSEPDSADPLQKDTNANSSSESQKPSGQQQFSFDDE